MSPVSGEGATDLVDFTLTPLPTGSSVSVLSVSYITEGGRRSDKHLLVTVSLEDDSGNPAVDALVSIDLFRDDGSLVGSATGATGNRRVDDLHPEKCSRGLLHHSGHGCQCRNSALGWTHPGQSGVQVGRWSKTSAFQVSRFRSVGGASVRRFRMPLKIRGNE